MMIITEIRTLCNNYIVINYLTDFYFVLKLNFFEKNKQTGVNIITYHILYDSRYL